MVAVGFKARWSAIFLVLVLSIMNIFVNNFWSVHSAHPQRDFLKYDFFQTLSIVGGLILLVNMGPGSSHLLDGVDSVLTQMQVVCLWTRRRKHTEELPA